MSSNHFSLAVQPSGKSKSELQISNFNSITNNKNNMKKNKVIVYRGSALSHPKGKNIETGFQQKTSKLGNSDNSFNQHHTTPVVKQPNVSQNRNNAHSQPTSTDVREYFRNISTPLPTLSFDEQFDELVENMDTHPLNEAFEKFTQKLFKSDYSVLWYVQEKQFFSPSFKKSVPKGSGILNSVAESQKYTYSNTQETNLYYQKEIDAVIIPENYSILVIPIIPTNGQSTKFVLQLGREPNKYNYNEKDFSNVSLLQSKLKVYGGILFNQQTELNESSQLIITNMASHDLCVKLKKYFKCDKAEFWCMKQASTSSNKDPQIFVITEETTVNTGDPVATQNVGIIKNCLFDKITINSSNVKALHYYNPQFDGNEESSALAISTMSDSMTTWAVILRGHKNAEKVEIPFTIIEESILNAVFPFALRALRFVVSPPQIDAQLDHFEQRLKALLEVAEILSGVLDLDILLPTIMDRACKLLNAERCSLFLVDNAHHELVTRFHGGLDSAIHLKIGRGIVGSCAESGEIVNIRDAYADQRFDRSVDLATGFTTRSLLCIPIYNNRGEITGVTEMINKKDEGLFDEDDEKMLMAFNVFCGISLDNARLYKASLDLTRQLRSFIQMSVALNTGNETLQSTLEEIMNNIRNIVNASRVTVFLNDENNNTLYEHISIGDPSPYGTMFAQEVAQNRKFMFFDHKEVLGRAQTQQLNAAIERILAAGLDADLMVFGADQFEYEEEEEEVYEDQYAEQYPNVFSPDSIEQPAIPTSNSLNRRSNVRKSATLVADASSLNSSIISSTIMSQTYGMNPNNNAQDQNQPNQMNQMNQMNQAGSDGAGHGSNEGVRFQSGVGAGGGNVGGSEASQRVKTPRASMCLSIPTSNINNNNNNITSNGSNQNIPSASSNNSLHTSLSTANKENSEVICGLPMLSSESTVLGVIELSCNWKVMSEDIKLLDCFSVFASVSIERSRLKDRAKFGQVEFEMKTWITDKERSMKGQIPTKLLIPMDKLSNILMVKFDAPEWDGIGHFKVIFAIFDIFDLMNFFNITNEKLFRFLFEIRNTYNKVPYHNWRHAVDVTQFTTFQILAGGLDTILTKFEIFGILISAVCHDADHDGFTNIYNVKAETPLGILFKNQSVMETHHCSVAINIITKDECNIFSSLSSADNKNMWTLIINLILSTDMAKHFDILKEFNSIFDEGKFSMDNQSDRLLLLKLLLKSSDISNVARPFELADKWCDVLCEEFFRQGDLEKAHGMEFTSPNNDREHLDKPKSQIGFYQFVCLPLYEALSKAVPKLECNVKQLLSNLDRWKEEKNKDEEK